MTKTKETVWLKTQKTQNEKHPVELSEQQYHKTTVKYIVKSLHLGLVYMTVDNQNGTKLAIQTCDYGPL